MNAGGVWLIDGASLRVLRFMPTGAGAHGLYPSRDARYLYVTNRAAGSISVDLVSPRGTSSRPGTSRRQPRHGQRLRRRQGAVALGTLERRGLRDRHGGRPPPRDDPRRAAARTGCASGRSPAATRSATPASCADRLLWPERVSATDSQTTPERRRASTVKPCRRRRRGSARRVRVRSEAAARQTKPEVDDAQRRARIPTRSCGYVSRSLCRRVPGRLADERVDVGIAADDAMEDDDVVRLDGRRVRDEVADRRSPRARRGRARRAASPPPFVARRRARRSSRVRLLPRAAPARSRRCRRRRRARSRRSRRLRARAGCAPSRSGRARDNAVHPWPRRGG